MTAYFDTNVIRYLGQGLAGQHLPQHLKERIVLSAVSAIELVSQIAVTPQEALNAIHTFENWLDTTHAVLLDWSETFVANHVFGLAHNEGVFELLQQVLGVCYRTDRPNARLIADSERLRDFNERAKRQKAELFRDAAIALRARALPQARLRGMLPPAITQSLRIRHGQQAAPITDAQIEAALSAYCEFHSNLVERAVNEARFNFFSRDHLNDLFDAEQVVYLAVTRRAHLDFSPPHSETGRGCFRVPVVTLTLKIGVGQGSRQNGGHVWGWVRWVQKGPIQRFRFSSQPAIFFASII